MLYFRWYTKLIRKFSIQFKLIKSSTSAYCPKQDTYRLIWESFATRRWCYWYGCFISFRVYTWNNAGYCFKPINKNYLRRNTRSLQGQSIIRDRRKSSFWEVLNIFRKSKSIEKNILNTIKRCYKFFRIHHSTTRHIFVSRSIWRCYAWRWSWTWKRKRYQKWKYHNIFI